MFTPTAFEILLSKRRSVLSPTQRGTGSERAKKKETLLKRDAIKRVVHSHNFKYLHVMFQPRITYATGKMQTKSIKRYYLLMRFLWRTTTLEIKMTKFYF